jgi:hypothetical protein
MLTEHQPAGFWSEFRKIRASDSSAAYLPIERNLKKQNREQARIDSPPISMSGLGQ